MVKTVWLCLGRVGLLTLGNNFASLAAQQYISPGESKKYHPAVIRPLEKLAGTDEYDFSCQPEDTLRTASSIPGVKVTIMKEVGHFPVSENPAQFRKYIIPVLEEIRRLKG